MLDQAIGLLRRATAEKRLPAAAREEALRDRAGLPETDPGLERVMVEAMNWMSRAQDRSTTTDGGVARDFSLINGWGSSYPETTGYIIPTFLDYADLTGEDSWRKRARRMLDWLARIQMPGGGIQGGKIDSTPVVPVTFNTGQVLLGFARGATVWRDYDAPMRRAADWLVETQDDDGCWRKHPTPFAAAGEKAYETHVAWGLLEAARVAEEPRYGDAALANVRWALGWQADNGWFDRCCLDTPAQPLTHTLGYVLRGLVEAYRYTKDDSLLSRARRTADGILTALRPDGYLPGRLNRDWSAAADYVCLTGSVQLARCWMMLFEDTGEARYRDAGFAANAFVRRTVHVDGDDDTRGGVKGSFPVDGDYGKYQYLNWAPKFLVDSLMLEQKLRAG